MDKLLITLFIAFILASCGGKSTETETTTDVNAGKDAEPELAETKKLPISIEGTKDSVDTELFMSSMEFPIPFYTYVPTNITISETLAVKGSSASFLMNEASLSLFVFPEPVKSDSAAIAEVQKLMKPIGGVKLVEGKENVFYAPQSGKRTINIEIGNKGEKYYYWIMGFPTEYTEGFVPRAELIKDQIEWRF